MTLKGDHVRDSHPIQSDFSGPFWSVWTKASIWGNESLTRAAKTARITLYLPCGEQKRPDPHYYAKKWVFRPPRGQSPPVADKGFHVGGGANWGRRLMAPPPDFGGAASGGPLLGGPASYPHLRTRALGSPARSPVLEAVSRLRPALACACRGTSLVGGSHPAGRRAPAGYIRLAADAHSAAGRLPRTEIDLVQETCRPNAALGTELSFYSSHWPHCRSSLLKPLHLIRCPPVREETTR